MEQEAAATMADAEQIAQAFHEAFERLSPGCAGHSASPWAEVPGHYRTMLTEAIQELLDHGVITGGSVSRERPDEERIRDAMAEARDHPGRVITR